MYIHIYSGAVPWLKQFVAGPSQQRPDCDQSLAHAEIVVAKLALGQFSPVSMTTLPLHTHIYFSY